MTGRENYQDMVARYSGVMSAVIRRVCGKRHAAQIPDIRQEVYLVLWKQMRDGKEIRYPAAYMHKTALTTAVAAVSRCRREEGHAHGSGDRLPVFASSSPRALLPAEQTRMVDQALEQLEPNQALALRAYLIGFNHDEVARLQGWSVSVARHHVYRGINELKRRAGAEHRSTPWRPGRARPRSPVPGLPHGHPG